MIVECCSGCDTYAPQNIFIGIVNPQYEDKNANRLVFDSICRGCEKLAAIKTRVFTLKRTFYRVFLVYNCVRN